MNYLKCLDSIQTVHFDIEFKGSIISIENKSTDDTREFQSEEFSKPKVSDQVQNYTEIDPALTPELFPNIIDPQTQALDLIVKNKSKRKPKKSNVEKSKKKKIHKETTIKKKISKTTRQSPTKKKLRYSQNYIGTVFRGFARFLFWIKLSSLLYAIFVNIVPDHIIADLFIYVEEKIQGKTLVKTKNGEKVFKSKISTVKEVIACIHDQNDDTLQTKNIKKGIRDLLTWFLSQDVFSAWLKNDKNSKSTTKVKAYYLKNRLAICNSFFKPKLKSRIPLKDITPEDVRNFEEDKKVYEENAPLQFEKQEDPDDDIDWEKIGDLYVNYNQEFAKLSSQDEIRLN